MLLGAFTVGLAFARRSCSVARNLTLSHIRHIMKYHVLSVSRRNNNSSFQPFVIVIIEFVLFSTTVATLGLSAKSPTCVFANTPTPTSCFHEVR